MPKLRKQKPPALGAYQRARQAKGQIGRDCLAATGDGEQMKRFRIKLERCKVKSERDSNGLVAQVQGGAPPQPVGRQCTWERKGARGAPPPTRPRVGTTCSSNTSFATVRTNETGAQLYINSDDEVGFNPSVGTDIPHLR